MAICFSKMHGAGNDFVVIDLRAGQPPPDAALARAMAHRHTGVGFDQLLTIESSDNAECVARYRIWNGDGSLAQQCGNGARCVAAWLVREGVATGDIFSLDSPAGVIAVERLTEGHFALNMGLPVFVPARIPFFAEREQIEYTLTVQGERQSIGAASMGNPHALILTDDIARVPVPVLGPAVQNSGLFPEGVNVGFAQIVSESHIRLRVFERGAGETLACGSGACAAVAILVRQGHVGRRVAVHLPGGVLDISWPSDTQPIRMAGPTAFVFEGQWHT